MSSRHTTGPWTLSDIGDYSDFDGKSRVILGDDMRICVVHTGGEPENEANARLIVAAPDLLQALDRAARSLLSMNLWLKDHPHCGVCEGARGILIRDQREAESVIAKVKGGTT